jgi:hypothetical protein
MNKHGFAGLFKFCQGFLLVAIVLSLLGAAPGAAQAAHPQLPNPPQLLTPNDRAVLVTLTPKLSWSAIPGVGYYAVKIGPDQDFGPGTFTRAASGASYTVPFTDGLKYGSTYYWQIVAFMADPSADPPILTSLVRRFTLGIMKSPADGAYVSRRPRQPSPGRQFPGQSIMNSTCLQMQVLWVI